jgi:predicted phage terminase large subunit-like protein
VDAADLVLPLGASQNPLTYLTIVAAERMRRDFVTFAQRAWHVVEPKRCVWNWHMDALAEHLVYVTLGEIQFLMVNVPPRMTKSTLCSVIWPAWHWLHKPGSQFIGASYHQDLTERDANQSRRLIESGWWRQFYEGEFYLLPDDNAKRMYRNSVGGYRLSTSVNGRSTGDGGDIQILDDPHNVQKVESDSFRQTAVSWHDNAWRSRLNDPNKSQKVYIGQRSHDGDTFGHVLSQEKERWTLLLLPMEFDRSRRCITYTSPIEDDDPKVKSPPKKLIFKDPRKMDGELLNPKRFNSKTTKREKDTMSARAWNAQYQQQPEGQGGLILKRHWWKPWTYPDWHPNAGREREMPNFFEIFQVYDTAFEEDEEADYTARTTWGVFENKDLVRERGTKRVIEGDTRICAMLLDRFKDRVGFPDLRDEAIRSDKVFGPDSILVEKKASGHSLVQELRRKKLPVKAVKIEGDLVYRAHVSCLMLEKGHIFYPTRNWAIDVIDECAKFPVGEHDDQVATCVIAWQYLRRYYDLVLPDDEQEEEIDPFRWNRQIRYA